MQSVPRKPDPRLPAGSRPSVEDWPAVTDAKLLPKKTLQRIPVRCHPAGSPHYIAWLPLIRRLAGRIFPSFSSSIIVSVPDSRASLARKCWHFQVSNLPKPDFRPWAVRTNSPGSSGLCERLGEEKDRLEKTIQASGSGAPFRVNIVNSSVRDGSCAWGLQAG